jgi:GxxExxY protein
MEYEPIPEEDERIGKLIVDAAYVVHRALGPGLLEAVYEVCFCHELENRGLKADRQVPVPIVYDGLTFDEGFRMDVFVNERVVCELKAVEKVHPVVEAQLLTYLKLTNRRLGFIINFNAPRIKDGIDRKVL